MFLATAIASYAGDWSIEETEFFVLLYNVFEEVYEFDTTLVPLVPDQSCYGWRIRVKGTIKLMKFKEILALPKEPITWAGEDNEFTPKKNY